MTIYLPSHFRVDDTEHLAAFVEKNAFGTLVSSGPGTLHVSHVPFLVERVAPGSLRLLGHVARANGHWQALEGADHVTAIFHGPHGYISPRWYLQQPSVPTWNYAAVHASGRARLVDAAGLREIVRRLAETYEGAAENPWRMEELPRDYADRMLAAIVGFEIAVERLEGKFKLSQNRPGELAAVIASLDAAGESELAELMRATPPAKR